MDSAHQVECVKGSEDVAQRLVSELPRPVFITGSYRSGTSILTWAIGAHPHFHPLEETGWIVPLGAGALAGYDVVLDTPRNFFEVYGVSRSEYIAQVGTSIDGLVLKASLNGSPLTARRRWVDGTPENTKHILLLRELFPAAKFIFLVRDPIDTVSSMMYFDRAGGASARSLPKAARAWSSLTHRGLLAYRAFGPDIVKIVFYSELVDKPAETLEGIFEFLNDSHAPAAASMMHERINSSQVTREEREAIRRRLSRSRLGKRLKRRYDEALSVLASPWKQDARALRELESLQPLPTSTFASGRFVFVRWVLARLREILA
jgi:hypothetical protein